MTDNFAPILQTACDVLGVGNLKTTVLGGTLIDVDEDSGYTTKAGVMSGLRRPDQVVTCPNDALLVYPTIEQAERENDGHSDLRAVGGLWINGFMPYSRGIMEPDNMSKAGATVLAKFGMVTVEQLFKSRPDNVLVTLFTFFKWYGGTDEDRILPKEVADNTGIGGVIRRGMACSKWAIKPLPVRYVVKIRGDAPSRDHVYLVGGSPELLADNFTELAKSIGDMYKTARSLMDAGAKTTVPNDVKYCDELSNPQKVWHEYDEEDYSEAVRTHSVTKARLLFKKLNRTIQGIIFIRNYFHFAKHFMKIKKVADFNLKNGSTPVEVDIDVLVDRYEDVYQYVRNLCRIYPEIGSGKLD